MPSKRYVYAMLRGALSRFQRWQYRGGRPSWSARVSNPLGAIAFAAGIGPGYAATVEIHGRKTGQTISFPVVVADYHRQRYLVAMLGQQTKWVRNVRAAVLRRYLELAPGARPFVPIDRRASLEDFERIVNAYAVFRVI
jgi:hypothetical protein